ncbi:MAG: diguanylate cyclase [bacterium]|nr:diguanylate cyclase [bacterium]
MPLRNFFRKSATSKHVSRRETGIKAMVLFDTDRLKFWTTTTFGHAGGQSLVTALVDWISQNIRPEDTLQYCQGNLIAVVLSQADLQGALAFSHRLESILGNFLYQKGYRPVSASVVGVGLLLNGYHTVDNIQYIVSSSGLLVGIASWPHRLGDEVPIQAMRILRYPELHPV